ncbi:MAG: DUF3365 domain-containing protein [Caldimicrobium sp.]|nr:DUF3365 domain-containing protein [Caldimicrobium sp.]MCX7873996.1 DUF3365 domain-containing protein [Caldimicrobium sp.]MDW8094144.1 DUF3365 domain-containing protein [Caldimicrobium sp.]
MKTLLRKTPLSSKIFILLLLILILFSGLLSLAFYFHLRERVLSNSYEKMTIIFAQMDALGKYVMYNLRPTIIDIFEELGLKDKFVREAMSTTHVRKIVMEYFKETFPQVTYERVSPIPINPENKFKSVHYELLAKFKEDTSLWKGLIKTEEDEFLIIAKPIFTQRDCLLCHGSLRRMPKALLKYYELKKDFPWKEGDIIGIELVKYPVKEALNEVRALVIGLFLISVFSAIILLFVLEGLLYSIIVKPLKLLNSHFKDLREGKISLKTFLPVVSEDEIGELFESFNKLSSHLDYTQRTLYENFKTLETLFESITHPIALINSCCEVEIANHAYKGSPYKKCNIEFIHQVFIKKENLKIEVEEDGRTYLLSLYPVFDNKGEVIKVVQILEDITEKKMMEERLIMTEKLAAIGQLSAGLAHEINNPLSGIILLLNQLKREQLNPQERQNYFELIQQGLNKIQMLIKDLLNFARTSDLKPQRISINEIIKNLLNLSSHLLEKEKVKVIFNQNDHIPEIFLDKDKIEQVFLNIILNAIQAMENTSEKVLIIDTYIRDNKVCISFQDNGPGIPENIANRIFDPFFTTKGPDKGTGLGLSVSLAIVEKHGGRIYLDKSDKGAKFVIEFPLSNN